MVTATRAPTRRGLTAERLARILDLERAGGCHDRAVIGGLDTFLDTQAGQSAEVQELAWRLAPARYRELSPAARTTWLNTEIARLTGDAPAAPAGAPAPAQPAATPKPAADRARAKARAAPSPAPPAETALKDARLGIRHKELACYEALGIATVDDLLIHYPFRYHDFSATRSVRDLHIGEEGAVSGVVVSVTAERWRGRMHGACKARVRDAFGNMLAVTWFNQPWLATRLSKGSGIALVGKAGFNDRRGEVTMANPEFYLFDAREEYRGRLVPVYRSTRGLSQTMLRRHIEKALERFLPRFNARFAVAARQPAPAWRPLDPALDLEAILAFRHTRTVARDNTVKYHWRTLQLLPSPQRPSYAGAKVEVLERPHGDLAVRHQGETIPSRLAPPRSGVLRERRSELALDPALERIASGLGPSGGPPRPQAHPATTNGTIVNAAAPTVLRSPTASQAARWKAIQQALLQGLSMRATARLLGISRNTIRRYVRAGGPPGHQDAASSTEQRPPKRTFSLNR